MYYPGLFSQDTHTHTYSICVRVCGPRDCVTVLVGSWFMHNYDVTVCSSLHLLQCHIDNIKILIIIRTVPNELVNTRSTRPVSTIYVTVKTADNYILLAFPLFLFTFQYLE